MYICLSILGLLFTDREQNVGRAKWLGNAEKSKEKVGKKYDIQTYKQLTIILWNRGKWWQNIYRAAERRGKYSPTIHRDWEE